jgi:hypothetical protein
VDDGLPVALVGGEPAVAQRAIGGRGPRQRHVEVVRGAEASELGVRVADPRVLRRDAGLALQCQRQPDADGEAVLGSDHVSRSFGIVAGSQGDS